MKKSFAILLSLLMAVAVITPALASPKVVDAPTIGRYGGKLSSAHLSDPKTFNYFLAKETSSTDPLDFVFEGLTGADGVTTEVVPALAESWDFSEDGKVWTFHLRKGVKWHDGAEFTADDVIFSFDLVYDENIPNNFRDGLTIEGEPIKYEKIDDYTVRFTLPKAFAPLLREIGIPIVPKHILYEPWKNGTFNQMWGVDTPVSQVAGTGPFKMVDYQQGQYIVYARNPSYWKVDKEGNQLPYISRYIYQIVENLDTISLKFKKGETDVYAVRGSEYDLYQQDAEKGNYTIYDAGPTFSTNFVVFNQNTKFVQSPKVDWFQNIHFRRAVAHAVDKQSIINSVFAGHAKPQWSPVSEPNKAFLNTDVKKYEYDLDQAAAQLAEGGFAQGADGVLRDAKGNAVEFNLSTNAGNNEREAIGQLLAEDLGKLGIKVNFQPLDFNLLVKQLLSGEGWDGIIIGLTGGVEPNGGKNVWHHTGGLHMWNVGRDEPQTEWEARVDELFEQGTAVMDPAERKKIYDEWQVLVSENLPVVYTVAPIAFYAARNYVQNYQPTAYGSEILPNSLHNIEVLWIKR